MSFEVYKDKASEFRWRLKSPNNEIISSSKGYKDKTGCENGIATIKKIVPTAKMVDLTKQ